MHTIKLIGLAGRAAAGKDTVADHLVARYGFTKLAFADALKQMLITAGMCTHAECYVEKTEQSRWLLQKIGTEIFRKQVHSNYWVQQTAKKISELLAANKRVVLSDIRFPNEAKLVSAYLKHGILIEVQRMNEHDDPYIDETAGIAHDSERLVAEISAEYLIKAQSGDVQSLYAQMDYIMKKREASCEL